MGVCPGASAGPDRYKQTVPHAGCSSTRLPVSAGGNDVAGGDVDVMLQFKKNRLDHWRLGMQKQIFRAFKRPG
jgi:hypothetical protein